MKSPSPSHSAIHPADLHPVKSQHVLLDVRTPPEFEETHIDGAILHPLSELTPTLVAELARDASACTIICRSGNRARQAAEKLAQNGIENIHILEGGMLAWEGANLPVIRGKATMSLERQVRIAAGALVIAGVSLAFFVDQAWMILPAFVGAGLVFAGITDTCGMGLLLAKMPWNRGPRKSAGNCCNL